MLTLFPSFDFLDCFFSSRRFCRVLVSVARLASSLRSHSDDKISLTTPSKFSNALISSLTHRAFYNGFYGSTNYEPGVSSHNVLMHDPLVRTVRELAPWVVKQMRDLGFTPVTVGQCAGVGSPAAWYHPPVSAAKRVFNATTWMCPEEKTRPRCWPWQGRCLAKKGAVTIPRPWTGAV